MIQNSCCDGCGDGYDDGCGSPKKMIAVRVATLCDVQRILEIASVSISPAWTYASVADRIERDDTLLLVAVVSGRGACVVGFAAFRQVGDDGELLQIAVDEKARREGVGSELLSEVLKHAEEKSLGSVFLEVRESNVPAISFYEKFGFKQLHIRKAYYDDPVEDALIMIREVARGRYKR